jgi:hypothetical protein
MLFIGLYVYFITVSILYPITTLLFYLSLSERKLPIFRLFLLFGNILWVVLSIVSDTASSLDTLILSLPLFTLLTLIPMDGQNSDKLDYGFLAESSSLKNKLKSNSNLNIISLFIAISVLIIFYLIFLIAGSL